MIALLVSAAAPLAAQSADNTYCNNRFGFCVTYSEKVMLAEEQPINGDGIYLENATKDVAINIAGSHNVMDWTPEKIYSFTKEEFGAEKEGSVESVRSEMMDKGFEAIIRAGSKTQHSRMWSNNGAYLVITIEGPSEKEQEIEALWEELKVDMHELEKQ